MRGFLVFIAAETDRLVQLIMNVDAGEIEFGVAYRGDRIFWKIFA